MIDFYVYLKYLKIFWQILNFVFLSLVFRDLVMVVDG